MNKLRRMAGHVVLSLEYDVLAADDPRQSTPFDEDTDTEVLELEADMEQLDALVDSLLADFAPHATEMDRASAVKLHRLLRIPRRTAADRRFWAWLGLCRYPHLVAHRWAPGKTGIRSIDRFSGNRVRQTFARLWWLAELTVAGEDYELTDRLLALSGFQDINEAIFGRSFCGYRPALAAFVEVLGDRSALVVRETAKELTYALTTRVVETMSTADLTSHLEQLTDRVEKKLED